MTLNFIVRGGGAKEITAELQINNIVEKTMELGKFTIEINEAPQFISLTVEGAVSTEGNIITVERGTSAEIVVEYSDTDLELVIFYIDRGDDVTYLGSGFTENPATYRIQLFDDILVRTRGIDGVGISDYSETYLIQVDEPLPLTDSLFILSGNAFESTKYNQSIQGNYNITISDNYAEYLSIELDFLTEIKNLDTGDVDTYTSTSFTHNFEAADYEINITYSTDELSNQSTNALKFAASLTTFNKLFSDFLNDKSSSGNTNYHSVTENTRLETSEEVDFSVFSFEHSKSFGFIYEESPYYNSLDSLQVDQKPVFNFSIATSAELTEDLIIMDQLLDSFLNDPSTYGYRINFDGTGRETTNKTYMFINVIKL
jgi:hypothetical protein